MSSKRNMKTIEIKGEKFGRLTAIRLYGRDSHGQQIWHCKCQCGNTTKSLLSNLKAGISKSCGCARIESLIKAAKTHGLRKHKLYTTWHNMKARCLNKKNYQYKDYGGRGITVSKIWAKSFISFYNWAMKNGWSPSLTLDRVDNNRGYYPTNCKFSTRNGQSRNQRSNHLITYNGLTLCCSEWADRIGIKYTTLNSRINRQNWPIEKALTKPLRKW